jgi:ADP-dependent NAD(P)H-hydrate dehydratase / NAD(P)H-hydrate epimerase
MDEATPRQSIDAEWVAGHLPPRPAHAHKGTFGRLLILAGSLDYAGAALLCGLGAARAGAGLVCVASPESVTLRLMGLVPELISMPLAEEAAGLISPAGWRRVATEASAYDALVIGPGLGRQPGTLRRTRGLIGELRRPAVIDADGLNALAGGDRWWRDIEAPLVLTPHPVEFGRLGHADPPPDDDAARAAAAIAAARDWNQVVVLKGANTVVAAPDGTLLRSDVATPALATAGSGDVLAGAIGALLAAGLEPFAAAACGVALHGAAGLLAEDRIGPAGTMAHDIAHLLPAAARSFGERRG